MIELNFQQKDNIGFQYIIDELAPCSPYGEERIKGMKPFTREQKPELLRQLQNIQRVLENRDRCASAMDKLMHTFMCIKNIRKIAEKCCESTLNAIELFEVKRFLLESERMLPLFAEVNEAVCFDGITLKDTTEALELLDPEKNRVASFYISDMYSQELRAIRKEKRALEEAIRRAEGEEKEELQAKRVLVAVEEEHEERKVRIMLSEQLRPFIPAMLHNMDAIAQIDLSVQKAALARRYGAVLPVITENQVDFAEMTNPQIADSLKKRGNSFTPISLALCEGATVITGANMGGKTISLKLCGQTTILAQYGFFVGAKEAKVGLSNYVQILIGDSQSVERGLSSFGSEMEELKTMLDSAVERTMLLIDEIASGTNPVEGLALTRSLVDYLITKPYISLLTTHFETVTETDGVVNMQVRGLADVDFNRLNSEIQYAKRSERINIISKYMDYRLCRVEKQGEVPKDALNIAKMLGVSNEIIEGAKKYIK
jgi:dsDNA-specific endonuclease/ATPase MutS2